MSRPKTIRQGVAEGTIVITQNLKHRKIAPLAIGKGLRTKVNANVGTSEDHNNIEEELEKVRVAIEAGADTIMDLSTGPGHRRDPQSGHEGFHGSGGNRAHLPGGDRDARARRTVPWWR